MNASFAEYFIVSGIFFGVGVGLAVLGGLVRVGFGSVKLSESISPLQKSLVIVSYVCVMCGGFAIALSVLGALASTFFWLHATFLSELTPKGLAIISIVFGPLPLAFSCFALGVMKILGGHSDGGGVHVKPLLGVNLSGVLTALFMMHWLTIFTGGLAVLGLWASGIWALFF